MGFQQTVQNETNHTWNVFAKEPLVAAGGRGVYLSDVHGRRYLDFFAGIAVNVLGHAHPELTKTIASQAATLIHCSNNYYTPSRGALAARLAGICQGMCAFFSNSGAEANEGAIKLARKVAKLRGGPEKSEIISFDGSFHGRTLATLAASGSSQGSAVFFGPLPPGFRILPFNDADALEEVSGPATAAILLETIQGNWAGTRFVTPGFAEAITRVCRKHGVLLIADEVQAGMGRTGRFFSFQHFGLTPDIVTIAKGLAGGVPIGVTLAEPELAAVMGANEHGSTFGGNPLACAAAVTVLDVIERDNLVGRACDLGTHLQGVLEELAERFGTGKPSGLGLMRGLPVASERALGLLEHCRKEGLLVGLARGHILRFLPPLIIERSHIEAARDLLLRAMSATI